MLGGLPAGLERVRHSKESQKGVPEPGYPTEASNEFWDRTEDRRAAPFGHFQFLEEPTDPLPVINCQTSDGVDQLIEIVSTSFRTLVNFFCDDVIL